MSAPPPPPAVNWDVTYACPLRCTHCYSESGRRASRQLGLEDMLRVADALISLKPASLQFSGGEPLLIKGLFQVAERFHQAGIPLTLYTSGWLLDQKMIPELFRLFDYIHVSVDGPTAEIHDTIRARAGSFERAMRALTLLDEGAREERQRGGRLIEFGIDCVVVRSNFPLLDMLCKEVAPRFPEMKFLNLDAAVPSGLASRPSYTERELLSDEQFRLLGSREHQQHLQSLAPASVKVRTFDGLALQLHPEQVASGLAFTNLLHVEPDGDVRGMAIYEGTVGNLLREPAAGVYERARERHRDPFVVKALTPVRTMKEWAEAVRCIDSHFGSEEVQARLARRQEYAPSTDAQRQESPSAWESDPEHAPTS